MTMTIFMTVIPILMCILLVMKNSELKIKVKDSKEYIEYIEEKVREFRALSMQLSRENQGYRKVIEKWELEQDRLNGDDWGI